jgi:hypothetical protein
LTVNLIDPKTIELFGICQSADAEVLLHHLLENPAATVDWSRCQQAHTAVIQVLMASKCSLKGPPAGRFLKTYIERSLLRVRGQIRSFAAGSEVRNI